jgi:hypothetical protein
MRYAAKSQVKYNHETTKWGKHKGIKSLGYFVFSNFRAFVINIFVLSGRLSE